MAENTKNLGLKKPTQKEFYNIDDFNENFQKIDDFAETVIHSNGEGKIDSEYLPEMDYIPTSEKGKASGVVPLEADGKVDAIYLPPMNYAPTDHIHKNTEGGSSHGTNASATYGGAVGNSATSTSGGAVGYSTSTTSGGAVGSGATSTTGGAVGSGAKTQSGGAVGWNATATEYGGAVGTNASATNGGAVGNGAKTGTGFAGGQYAITTDANGKVIDAIQLGAGTNTNDRTLQVYGFQLMDAVGKIPTDRMPTNYRKIVVGKYTGTGSYVVGTATPTNIAAGRCTIQLPSYPRLILIKRRTEDIWTQIAPNPDDNTVDFFSYGGNNYAGGLCTGEITSDYKFHWYALTQSWGYKADLSSGKVSIVLETIASDKYASLRPIYQLNWEGNIYDYIAFCD